MINNVKFLVPTLKIFLYEYSPILIFINTYEFVMQLEFGLEGKVSTSADVYSYGIMLLEMFTRKKPTDDMFNEEMNLKKWVSEALQVNAIDQVFAPGLLSKEGDDYIAEEECVRIGNEMFR